MKWYWASRTKHKEKIDAVIQLLESHDQQITYNWAGKPVFSPQEYQEHAPAIADEINQAIHNTDIFVLISDEHGTDMFVELGMMLQASLDNPESRIYILGDYNTRSLMHHHPRIRHVGSVQDIFLAENLAIVSDIHF